jgi:hypothetical protein
MADARSPGVPLYRGTGDRPGGKGPSYHAALVGASTGPPGDLRRPKTSSLDWRLTPMIWDCFPKFVTKTARFLKLSSRLDPCGASRRC